MKTNVPCVWVVDDDEDDQFLIGTALQQTISPVTIRSFRKATDLLPALAELKERPQLLLLDINMPFQDGYETLKQLRSNANYAALPVVMLTTSSQEADHRRSLALGANQFVTKPSTFQEFVELAASLSQRWLLVDRMADTSSSSTDKK